MEASGRDAKMQIDIEIEGRIHRECRVLRSAGSSANSFPDLALKHRHDHRDQFVMIAEDTENRGRGIEGQVANHLYPSLRDRTEVGFYEIRFDDCESRIACKCLAKSRCQFVIKLHNRQAANLASQDALGQ